MRSDSLLIQDLGYFNLETLKAVAGQQAFFLSRWKQDACVYLARDPRQALDMLSFLRQQQVEAAEYDVLLGAMDFQRATETIQRSKKVQWSTTYWTFPKAAHRVKVIESFSKESPI